MKELISVFEKEYCVFINNDKYTFGWKDENGVHYSSVPKEEEYLERNKTILEQRGYTFSELWSELARADIEKNKKENVTKNKKYANEDGFNGCIRLIFKNGRLISIRF